MKTLFLIITTSLLLSACSSPPQPNEPKGKWYQINSSHYYEENANKTITTTNSILKKPNLLPKKLPASITPIVCKVIGTGIKGKGIGGIKPKTATIAANIAA